jgi:hypothetical protein
VHFLQLLVAVLRTLPVPPLQLLLGPPGLLSGVINVIYGIASARSSGLMSSLLLLDHVKYGPQSIVYWAVFGAPVIP